MPQVKSFALILDEVGKALFESLIEEACLENAQSILNAFDAEVCQHEYNPDRKEALYFHADCTWNDELDQLFEKIERDFGDHFHFTVISDEADDTWKCGTLQHSYEIQIFCEMRLATN